MTNYVIVVVLLMLDFWTVTSPHPLVDFNSTAKPLEALDIHKRPLADMFTFVLSITSHGSECAMLATTLLTPFAAVQTKNVAGRLLVGLRWWNEVTDEGSNWRFETLEEVQPSQTILHVLSCLSAWQGQMGEHPVCCCRVRGQ